MGFRVKLGIASFLERLQGERISISIAISSFLGKKKGSFYILHYLVELVIKIW
jgi:hypothetical protein